MHRNIFVTLALALIVVAPANAVMSANKKQKALERVRYSEFAGKQQDWPTASKPMIEIQHTKYGTPIYYDLPNKPYEILGTFQATGDSVIKRAVEAAQAAGADAVLAASDKAFTDAGIQVNPQQSMRGSAAGKLKLLEGILIRWKRGAVAPAPAVEPGH